QAVVAALAVFKAGGAYLPLDPAYPRSRLEFMLDDADVRVLITERALSNELPTAGRHVVYLDDTAAQLAEPPCHTPANPENIAYIIYTSGSTGRPKGIAISHQALVNLLTWYQRTYRLQTADRMAHLAGASFDVGVSDLWAPLSSGASLHLPPTEEVRVIPWRVLGWLAQQGITVAFLPTPLAELVLQEDMPPDLPLRYLLTAGDQLSPPAQPGLPIALAG